MNAQRIIWPEPPAHLALAPGEVHVWAVKLTQPAPFADKLAALLEPEEQERAARFQFEHLRQSFRVSHGALRLILSRYVNLAPAQLRFKHGPFGKPELEPKSTLRFNLSHSGELALLGVTLEHEIGVDVEALRPIPEADSIARINFSAKEFAAFCRLEQQQKLFSFFNCWTRKEAFIKAHGAGLRMPLDQFEVAFAPNEPARLLSIHGNTHAAEHWTLCALHPADGYVAALAVAVPQMQISCWRWSEDGR